jgi:hypothetical protein
MTQEQILLKVQQAWPKWGRERFPKFIFESGTWYAHEFESTAGNGETVVEALYHHVNLVSMFDMETIGDSSRWSPILDILAEYVVDPIFAKP